jgi:Predicted dehydrogenases and related proteins
MKKVSIAVIGCGRIGQMHAKNIQLHGQTNLACIYDPNDEFATKVSNELSVVAIKNVDDIFNSNDIDAVLIASPT